MSIIKNYSDIAISKERGEALAILEAGISAIDTKTKIKQSVKLEENLLYIQDTKYDLTNFDRIYVVGYGKASGEASSVIEEILGEKITDGIVIDIDESGCKRIQSFVGTHPMPSEQNVLVGSKIFNLLENCNEKDLVLVIVSGGGSSLLCYPESEMLQGKKLFEAFTKTGGNISELNTIRKHLSLFKGGGLAKVAYPATVVGLVISDVPGEHYQDVASGATYKDESTAEDAQEIINRYELGEFTLVETPKDDKYFEKVRNFILVSNVVAVSAMVEKGRELGFEAKVLGVECYDDTEKVIKDISNALGFSDNKDELVICAGEPSIEITKSGGMGGRNLHMNLLAMSNNLIDENKVFISFASDGLDNSPAMGAIVDSLTLEHFKEKNINPSEFLDNFDSYNAFLNSGDLIITGPTGSNVSDLMFLFNKNE